MQRDSDEDAWRAIVENYGDRAELEEDQASEPQVQQRLERLFTALPEPQPEAHDVDDDTDDLDDANDPDDFVPPDPPPLPRLPPDRLLAWVGLFGSPTVLLIGLVLNVHLPPWLGYLLVAGFVGGFAYLVVKMPRRDDVDPWDDGARL